MAVETQQRNIVLEEAVRIVAKTHFGDSPPGTPPEDNDDHRPDKNPHLTWRQQMTQSLEERRFVHAGGLLVFGALRGTTRLSALRRNPDGPTTYQFKLDNARYYYDKFLQTHPKTVTTTGLGTFGLLILRAVPGTPLHPL